MRDARNSPEMRKKSGIRKGRAQSMKGWSQVSLPSRLLDAERRVHQDDEHDADAFGDIPTPSRAACLRAAPVASPDMPRARSRRNGTRATRPFPGPKTKAFSRGSSRCAEGLEDREPPLKRRVGA